MALETLVAVLLVGQAAPGGPAAPAPPAAQSSRVRGAVAIQYAVPRGEIEGRAGETMGVSKLPQRDLISRSVEVEGQVGVEVARHWVVGAYLAIGGGAPADSLPCTETTCTARTARAGLLARLETSPVRAAKAWCALGVGAQRHRTEFADLILSSSDPNAPTRLLNPEIVMVGPEVRLMAGVEWRAARALGVGLFAAVSLGEYLDVTWDGQPFQSNAAATWFTLGVRAVPFP